MLPSDKERELEILRRIPSDIKLKTAFELFDFARERVASEIRRQNPRISESELKKILKERFTGR